MARARYNKWRCIQDFGIRPGMVLPAWNPGDLVEVIGTGLAGRIVRMTTLDYTMWEVQLGNRYITTHANNLRTVMSA